MPILGRALDAAQPSNASLLFISCVSGFSFAGGLWCGTVAFAMRSLVFLLAGLLASAGLIYGEIKTPENAPI
jgi:hypothetical protein